MIGYSNSSEYPLICYHLRAAREEVVSRFASVSGEEIIQINFCGVYYLTVSVYTKAIIHVSVLTMIKEYSA